MESKQRRQVASRKQPRLQCFAWKRVREESKEGHTRLHFQAKFLLGVGQQEGVHPAMLRWLLQCNATCRQCLQTRNRQVLYRTSLSSVVGRRRKNKKERKKERNGRIEGFENKRFQEQRNFFLFCFVFSLFNAL
jgi:hypothetical protein